MLSANLSSESADPIKLDLKSNLDPGLKFRSDQDLMFQNSGSRYILRRSFRSKKAESCFRSDLRSDRISDLLYH